MALTLVTDARYLDHLTGSHPEQAARLEVIGQALRAIETHPAVRLLAPEPAPESSLHRVHTSGLIERLRQACLRGDPALDLDTVICPASFDIARLAAGGAMGAVDAVLQGHSRTAFVACRPPGHHATRATSMGFCLFNNVAIAARHAQDHYGIERVLIVDWDVHHGNGTQDIFYRDSSVFFFSMHQSPLYPGTGLPHERGEGPGLGFTLNVPVPGATPPALYLERFKQALEQILARFEPELILISAGFDGHRSDLLGGLLLEDEDFAQLTRWVLEAADTFAGGRVVSVLEGGYHLPTLGTTVQTHVETLLGASFEAGKVVV